MGSPTGSPTATPASGPRLGRFEITGVLGEGAMGIVYQARDPVLGRQVALKLLHPDRDDDPEASARLLREAQALARLSHPNVVTIYEAGTADDGRVFLAMERVEGATARAWREAAPRPVEAIVRVYRQACAGLAAAHAAGLVHRDVKPDNILVGDDGRVRVTDFGLVAAGAGAGPAPDAAPGLDEVAPLTRTGMLLGTPPYMAPEAHTGGLTDPLSDQWSLCVALWEALSGVRPFAGATYRELVASIAAGAISRGEAAIAPALRAVLRRGLSVARDQRWPSLAAMGDALDEASDPREASPLPDAIVASSGGRRRRARVLGPALAGVALAGGLAYATWPDGRDHTPAAPAPVVPPTPRRLTLPGGCPYMPAFADDATVVYDDGRGDLWRVPVAGGEARRLTDQPGDQWRATRGRRPGEIVHSDPEGLIALDLATGARTGLGVRSFAFTVAGEGLVYARTDVAEVRRRAGGEDAPLFSLPDGLWQYALSASLDGRRLALTTHGERSTPTVCLAELAGGALARPLACLERDDVIMGRAALTPDGATLYYQTETGIRRRRLADGDDTLWLPGAYAYGGMEVARDGRALVYATTNPREIRYAPADALDQPVIAEPGSLADVSPDGRWVHVRWTSAGRHELVERAPDGTREVLVTGLGRLAHAMYDPTGARIVFEVDGKDGGIWVVDARGYPPVQLTARDGDSNPTWTADGRVAFTRWDDRKRPTLYLADPEAGLTGDATRTPAHPLPRHTAGRLPGGELLLRSADAETLFAWDPATGRERRIDTGGEPGEAISPDGRWRVVSRGAALWKVPYPDPRDGRTAEHVWTPPPCATRDRPVWDARGRLYVAWRPWQGDVYVVPLTDEPRRR